MTLQKGGQLLKPFKIEKFIDFRPKDIRNGVQLFTFTKHKKSMFKKNKKQFNVTK